MGEAAGTSQATLPLSRNTDAAGSSAAGYPRQNQRLYFPAFFPLLRSTGTGKELVDRTPVRGREGDAPEVWRRRIEFDADMSAFGHLARRSCDAAGHALFGLRVLENDAGVSGKPLLHNQQGAGAADAHGDRSERLLLALE